MTVETVAQKVRFIVDKNGKRTHAVLPIDEYEELFEDMHDAAVVKKRRKEGSISTSEMKKRL